MEIAGIVLSLLGLMYFAYRGINVLVLAPIMALFACLFHADTPVLASYTQIFMPALGGYLLLYFPVFLLGSIFGKLMSDSGAASVIGQYVALRLGAERGLLAVVLACAVLTYGGVSLVDRLPEDAGAHRPPDSGPRTGIGAAQTRLSLSVLSRPDDCQTPIPTRPHSAPARRARARLGRHTPLRTF